MIKLIIEKSVSGGKLLNELLNKALVGSKCFADHEVTISNSGSVQEVLIGRSNYDNLTLVVDEDDVSIIPESDFSDDIYPLTITEDRYNGTYSGAKYTAWNMDPKDIPEGPFSGDNECADFWSNNTFTVGKGNTPEEAKIDLTNKINKW